MSTKIVATTEYVDQKISDTREQIIQHEKRYAQTQFILTDTLNKYDYIIEIRNGNLISYCKCNNIIISKLPDKTSGVFDPAGMIVSVVMQDGNTKEVTNYKLSDAVNGVVTVTYNEAGIDYTATLNTSMTSVKEALIDFDYIVNEDGTYTLTGWKQTLNGVSSTEMIVPDSSLIIVEVA